MQFRVLGPVEVANGRERATVGSGSQRAILAVLLAARGDIVSADRLVDAMWGPRPPATARKSLHSHVSRLRRTLGRIAADVADPLETATDGYRLDVEHHEVDADRFEALVADARRTPDSDPEQALRSLDEALGLWRGAAFGELAGNEFVRAEAMRLEELRVAAVADRIDARIAVGDHQAVIGELEAAVVAEPMAERSHGQLMLALYRSGRQADALAVYRRLHHRLSEEVGVDPSPEVQELFERILRQDADLAVPERARSLRVGRVATGNRHASETSPPDGAPSTPATAEDPLGGLVGRGDDIRAVADLLSASSLVTLTGPGGVGKSRLAEAVAAEIDGRFDDGVVTCGLSSVRDPGSVTAALVDALGIHHKGDRPPEEVVLAALGTRRLLLVLDNCEHLLDAVGEVVSSIRGECPHVTILATSREYLRLPSERVWEVRPLPVPRAGADAADVTEAASGALMCARVRAVDPSFALTETNAAAIAELCRRLDGIPLAIELAAARIRALGPGNLAERIDHRFDLLTGGPSRDAGRHRTLQAVVDWSYELLTDPEARLFDRLSVFAGPFSLPAAEQVCAGDALTEHQVAALLAELVDKSLVVVDRAGGDVRYRLLETLRAFGERRLAEHGEAERTRSAHAGYHVRLAEELGARVRGPDEREAIACIDEVVDDLRVAHNWLLDAEDADGALRLSAALHDDLTFRPRAEVIAWAELALRLSGAPTQPAYPAALVTAARGAMDRGELSRARSLAKDALDLADAASLASLWARYLLTTVSLYEGQLETALKLAEERAGLAEALGSDYHRALAGVSLALGHRYRGEDSAAAVAAAAAREIAERSGNHTARAWTLYSSGEALLDSAPAEAATLLEQAIDAARQVQRDFIEGVGLVSLASLVGRTGDTIRAVELFREAIVLWRRLGNYTNQLTTLRNLVELLVRVGADEPAAVLYGAVTAGATPSFGAEAERLSAAWTEIEQRLGTDTAAAAAERGRRLPAVETIEAALADLDALLDGPAAGSRT